MDEMKRIVICKYCGNPEYYGDMRWLSGKCCCRNCYKADWEAENKKEYTWDDLDGKRPTIEDYKRQEKQITYDAGFKAGYEEGKTVKEEVKAQICDEYCRKVKEWTGDADEFIDMVCTKCPMCDLS